MKTILYQSSITQFLTQLKKNDPTLEQKQFEGRQIFWRDHPIDVDEQNRIKAATVPQRPYVYATE